MRHAWIVLIAIRCCAALSTSTAAPSQTADELIAKNIEARGGMEKIQAIKTLRATGNSKAGEASPPPLARRTSGPT